MKFKDSKTQRAKIVSRILDQYIPETPIPLEHKDAYTLLIAVLLSAQCTDDRVNIVTPILFKLADNPFDMCTLKVESIFECIKSCGLAPTKSKNILKLSEILCEKYNGLVPNQIEQLESLPGVGHKTASVIISQIFGQPAFPVDTHIHRCAFRWGLSSGKSVERTEQDLKKIFAKDIWNRLHLQIIYFARKFCKAKSHAIADCPMCSILVG